MILVTGATGFLGSHIICFLYKRKIKFRAIKRNQTSFEILKRVCAYYEIKIEDILETAEWIEADLLDIYSLEDCIEGIDKVIHAAALVSFQAGDKSLMENINIDGTANLVNICLNAPVKKFCHVSSIAAIGRADTDTVIDENIVWKASKRNSNYAVSKYGAEREVWRGIEEGLDAVIVNPSIILGPGEINSGSTRLIKTVQKGLKFYTPGSNGYVDVRDVVKVILMLLESDVSGERFILSSENIPYKKLFGYIAESLNKPYPRYKANKWMSELYWRSEYVKSKLTGKKPLVTKETALTAMNHYSYSNYKLKKQFDYKFIPIKESIKESCEYLLSKE